MPVESECGFYRLYWINGFGSIDAVAKLICAPSDADALRQAESVAAGGRVELWQAARLVAHLSPGGGAPAAAALRTGRERGPKTPSLDVAARRASSPAEAEPART